MIYVIFKWINIWQCIYFKFWSSICYISLFSSYSLKFIVIDHFFVVGHSDLSFFANFLKKYLLGHPVKSKKVLHLRDSSHGYQIERLSSQMDLSYSNSDKFEVVNFQCFWRKVRIHLKKIQKKASIPWFLVHYSQKGK